MRSLSSGLRLAAAACWLACSAHAADTFDTSAGNLLAVLRESPGANKQDAALEPFGKIQLRMADGREVQFEASWYQYIGDMHLRLVFDGGQKMQSAVPEDLQRLKLAPEQALAVATENLRKRYGLPHAKPYGGGLMQVEADAPEMVSSYFMDLDFWRAQQQAHPLGIVAAVPGRSGIVFAPADDAEALQNLRFSAAALFAADARARLSSALYLFKDGQWSVYQAAQADPR